MSNFNDALKVRGTFFLKVVRVTTDNSDPENPVVVETVLDEYFDPNLVVNGGRQALAKMAGENAADKQVSKIQFGTNGADPVVSDDEITDAFELDLTGTTYPTTTSVAFSFALGIEENNGTDIREFGLVCADGTLFARKVRAAISKTDEIRLEGVWTINFV